jgi:hypothetical protein
LSWVKKLATQNKPKDRRVSEFWRWPLTVGCWRRGGIEAEKLSNRTKVVGRIHFPKPTNSHEAKTVLSKLLILYWSSKSLLERDTFMSQKARKNINLKTHF